MTTAGMLSVLAVSEELKKQASMLALDQMIMVEVDNINKKGMQGFVVRNLVSPDIPDHLPNPIKIGIVCSLNFGSSCW